MSTRLIVALIVLLAGDAFAQPLVPGELMIFYGWPGRGMGPCGGCFPEGDNADRRAAEFGVYDDVVFGAGLELDTHPEHHLTSLIISHGDMAQTRVWGYVDLGVSTSNFSESEILARALSWKAMGAHGIFLDDFGHDFGVTRARQNAVVGLIHAIGLPVMANAFDPDDAFSSAVDPVWNPQGSPAALNAGDAYLYESHGVRLGELEDALAWHAKSAKLRSYQNAIGFAIHSSTSKGVDDPFAFDAQGWQAAWMLASIAGHRSTGYAEYEYSAVGASNASHVHRPRPSLSLGSVFVGDFDRSGDVISRRTDAGLLYVNLLTGTSAVLDATDAPTTAVGLRMGAPTPNPFNPRTAIDIEAPVGAVLEIFDARGRRVFRSAAPTRGTFVWDGRDDEGRPLSSGIYHVRVRTVDRAIVRKMALVR